jgi:hypothetical protein
MSEMSASPEKNDKSRPSGYLVRHPGLRLSGFLERRIELIVG